MALKLCFLFSIAFCLLLATKITIAGKEKSFMSESKAANASVPVSPPTTVPPPPPPSSICVGPCWERCHDIKAKNIRPCMIVCTRCCAQCNYVIPPTCTNWNTFTIEGFVYKCP